jgi:microcystin-dependent protein
MFDSALATLCAPGRWVVGDDPEAATVDEVVEAFKELLERGWRVGCREVGEIMEVAWATVPSWALPCDGQLYQAAAYPELYAVLDPAYKVIPGYFRTPHRDGKFALGGGVMRTQGGSQSVTLTENQMPRHLHTDIGHTHTTVDPLGEGVAFTPGELPVVIAQTPSITGVGSAVIGETGGNQPHENMPPYERVRFIIVAKSNG